MFDLTIGCLKWGAVGFVVTFVLMKLYDVLSTFAAMLSALVWLLVQNWG